MIDLTFALLALLVKAAVAVIIVLMLLRGMITWFNLNPFGWFAYNVRRLTEPMVEPLRRNLFAMQARRDIAPLLLVIFVLIVAYFVLGLLDQFHQATVYAAAGLSALSQGQSFQGIRYVIGALAIGVLSVVITAIIVQVIFSWVGVWGNWLARLVNRIAEPVLMPFRRMIPPLGVIDISPLIAIMILSLISAAVRAVIL
ncbi:MAG: YggT family protein [Acidobacteria bacterium]|nr:YggT family protein [Acidobacteriota bacterium]